MDKVDVASPPPSTTPIITVYSITAPDIFNVCRNFTKKQYTSQLQLGSSVAQ